MTRIHDVENPHYYPISTRGRSGPPGPTGPPSPPPPLTAAARALPPSQGYLGVEDDEETDARATKGRGGGGSVVDDLMLAPSKRRADDDVTMSMDEDGEVKSADEGDDEDDMLMELKRTMTGSASMGNRRETETVRENRKVRALADENMLAGAKTALSIVTDLQSMGCHPSLADLAVILDSIKVEKHPGVLRQLVKATVASAPAYEDAGLTGELATLLAEAAWAAVEFEAEGADAATEAVLAIEALGATVHEDLVEAVDEAQKAADAAGKYNEPQGGDDEEEDDEDAIGGDDDDDDDDDHDDDDGDDILGELAGDDDDDVVIDVDEDGDATRAKGRQADGEFDLGILGEEEGEQDEESLDDLL